MEFMDQMLEFLDRRDCYYFLHGYSKYNQIIISPKGQEKTTFICPYGTFASKRMPFGLCDTPATFQRCMQSIFIDIMEENMKVFMDDFSIMGYTFKPCLEHLRKVLKQCVEINLVFYCNKCYIMVKEGIGIGHKIWDQGIQFYQQNLKLLPSYPIHIHERCP